MRACSFLTVGLLLTSSAAAAPPAVVAEVDRHIRSAWKADGITPAGDVDDAAYLRRATLDLTGTLPTPDRVLKFVDDKSADKRQRAVAELLQSPEYARHWATYWENILFGRLTREAYLDRNGFRKWLNEEFAQNRRWDNFVMELLTAEGYNTATRPKGGIEDPPNIEKEANPAVNYFLRYFRALPEFAGATSKTFLGVQIQCAQCHDHKTEKWTQQDFKQFTAFYAKTWPTYYDKNFVVGINRVHLKDRPIAPPQTEKLQEYFGSYKDYSRLTPKFLDGQEFRQWSSPRTALAKWMTSADNPWFAKAIVNRMWGQLLGRGFVEPIDDFRPSNPAAVPAALDALAADFVAHDFDLHHLLTAITATHAYQRECRQATSSAAPLWSAFPIKALDVEVQFDVLLQASGSESLLDKLTKGKLELVRNAYVRQFVTQLGTDDMLEITDFDETIPQSLSLLNGSLTNGVTRQLPGSGLQQVLTNHKTDKERIERLYLQTLSRKPSSSESSIWLAYLAEKRPVAKTAGPRTDRPQGLAAMKVSPEIAAIKAGDDIDFRELLQHAQTAADFGALGKMMRNNADAGLFVKSFEAWAAEVPFEYLAGLAGGDTPQEQNYENMFWALLNCSEFLTNH